MKGGVTHLVWMATWPEVRGGRSEAQRVCSKSATTACTCESPKVAVRNESWVFCLNFLACSGSVGLLPQGLETRSWGRGAKSGTGVASFPFSTFDELTAAGVGRGHMRILIFSV